MNAICLYCNKLISAKDMAKTDKEKELTGGGAKWLGYDSPSAGFVHEECYKSANAVMQEKEGNRKMNYCKYCEKQISYPLQVCDQCWRDAMKSKYAGESIVEELEK